MDGENQAETSFVCVVGSPGMCGPAHPRCPDTVQNVADSQ